MENDMMPRLVAQLILDAIILCWVLVSLPEILNSEETKMDLVDCVPGMVCANILFGMVYFPALALPIGIMAFSVAIAMSWIILYQRGIRMWEIVWKVWWLFLLNAALTYAFPDWTKAVGWLFLAIALPNIMRRTGTNIQG